MNSRSYVRQMTLPEVGTAGQERLAAARVTVPDDGSLAREIEARYLRGAGCTVAPGPASEVRPLGLSSGPEAVGQGALAALVALRAALGLGPPDDALDDTRGPTVLP
ncbi:MAG: hypothetical protein IPF92_02065 [Myxococcales bacterium]|nr:hypothetical protein [Myxococcales bacterium]MBL0193914.1 hypothetical protein [Myxococcales bacterium]HQY62103.1 hypothetical protein [Polyangiaceae bacterium]